jgi:hypothetical protein
MPRWQSASDVPPSLADIELTWYRTPMMACHVQGTDKLAHGNVSVETVSESTHEIVEVSRVVLNSTLIAGRLVELMHEKHCNRAIFASCKR